MITVFIGRIGNIKMTKSKIRHTLIVPMIYKYLLSIYYRLGLIVSPRHTKILSDTEQDVVKHVCNPSSWETEAG